MDVDKRYRSAGVTQDIPHTWSFAPASAGAPSNSSTIRSHTSSQHGAMTPPPSTTHTRTSSQPLPFSFRSRTHSRDAAMSPHTDAAPQDGLELLRARRHDAHMPARLLDPGYDSRRVPRTNAGPDPAHIPTRNAPFGAGASPEVTRHRASAPAKPRKSLSERLALGDVLRPPSQPPAQIQPRAPPAAAEEDMPLEVDPASEGVPHIARSRSRSASVVSSAAAADARGMQGVVMEAMRTIQRYEAEHEVQYAEIERLTARVALLDKEKEALRSKVQAVKEASLQKLATSSQSLDTLRVDLASLKADAQAFTCVSLADVQEVKDTIAHALNASAKYLENHGGAGSMERTREVINELKVDCMNKQQVLDMLRDRLSDALAELATSKNRVFELEDAYAADRLALKHATEQLLTTGSRASELAVALKQQQRESVNAVALAGELEHQLEATKSEVSRLDQLVGELNTKAVDAASLENHISELQSLVDDQKNKLELFEKTSQENARLKSVVEARDERVRALEEGVAHLGALRERNAKLEALLEERECKQKIDDAELAKLVAAKDSAVLCSTQLETQLHDTEAKSKLLEFDLLTKSQHLDELRALMGKLQGNFDASCQSVKTLEAELASSWAREAASRVSEASEKAQRLEEAQGRTANAQQLVVAERKVQDLLAEVAASGKRLEEAGARCQSLQERFEEQSITLRLTRDTSAELQDRLIAAEAGYAKNLEANCGSLRTQIAVLQEQNTALQIQCRSDVEVQRKESKAKEATLLQRIEDAARDSEVKCGELRTEIAVLREQNSACHGQLKEFSKKEEGLLQRVDDARKDFDREISRASNMKIQSERELAEVTRRNGDLETRLANVQEKLQVIPAPCKVHEEEIERLAAQASRISSEYDAMKERTCSLNYRYDKGDLDPEERILIKKIIHATQSTHDHELAQAQNELNRSNKLIGTLQDAKTMLENSLAKHLAAEAKLKNAAAKAGTSVMEFVNWPSSQPDISMEDCVPPAQDKDEPSTAPDDPPGGEESNTIPSSVFHPILVPDSPDRPLARMVRFSTPTSADSNRNFALPSAGPSKNYFSTIAPDQPDEIGEFEDETVSMKRKKVQSAQTGKVETAKAAKRMKTTKLPEDNVQSSVEPAAIKTVYKSKRKRR